MIDNSTAARNARRIIPVELIESYTAEGGIQAHITGLAKGFCRIEGTDATGYTRITQNHSRHGRRYFGYSTYAEAVAASFKWANRKPRADGR